MYVCAGAHACIAQGHVCGVLMNGITIISNSIKTNDFEILITFDQPLLGPVLIFPPALPIEQ